MPCELDNQEPIKAITVVGNGESVCTSNGRKKEILTDPAASSRGIGDCSVSRRSASSANAAASSNSALTTLVGIVLLSTDVPSI